MFIMFFAPDHRWIASDNLLAYFDKWIIQSFKNKTATGQKCLSELHPLVIEQQCRNQLLKSWVIRSFFAMGILKFKSHLSKLPSLLFRNNNLHTSKTFLKFNLLSANYCSGNPLQLQGMFVNSTANYSMIMMSLDKHAIFCNPSYDPSILITIIICKKNFLFFITTIP